MSTEAEQLEALLVKLLCQWGAESAQAVVMARQLIKRSKQMAEEKRIPEAAALDYLVKLTHASREGLPLPAAPEAAAGEESKDNFDDKSGT